MDPLRYIFNVSPNGLLLLEPSAKDDDWRCTLANKAASALLGQSTLKESHSTNYCQPQ